MGIYIPTQYFLACDKRLKTVQCSYTQHTAILRTVKELKKNLIKKTPQVTLFYSA